MKNKILYIIVSSIILSCIIYNDFNTKTEPISEDNLEYITCQVAEEIPDLSEFSNKFYNELIPLTEQEQKDLKSACDEFNIPYELALGIIDIETKFQNKVGDNGESFGYMQIQYKWHQEKMNIIGAKDLMIPIDNFRTGCYIMNTLLSGNNLTDALTIYNSGHGGESEYATSVINKMNEWKGKLNIEN